MEELVGNCHRCGCEIYCLDGFFEGLQKDDELYCNACEEEAEK
ncbi:hypothetical protein [Alkalicoccus halolimnae]|uniref:Uncharacterized protein n=1 Tax=Alkalicoccus halolimnae TaxID=1667239 RepID=A0AAJ8LV73_9BACI|nr:hypothetical protein [Alkalicoccus halolimnae]